MKIFLTGGSGFVGQALYPALLAQGHQVVCALRAGTFEAAPELWKGADPLLIPDLSPETDLRQGLSGTDAVIHLAGMAHIRTRYRLDLLDRFMAVNCEATLNLARQAARAGVKRFVFLSSIGVNGSVSPIGRPFRETDTPRPDTAYGMSKLAAEQGLKKLARETGMEVVILRPPLVFGPRARANFLSLMKWVHSGIPLPFAGIRNEKNFVGLSNLVDVLICCLNHDRAGNQTFLVCDAGAVSTPELIRKIASAMNRPPRLFVFPAGFARIILASAGKKRIYDQLWRDLSIDTGKMNRMLDWKPGQTLDEEIRSSVRWFLDSGISQRG